MRKVEAAAEQTAHVRPKVVWSLLSDVMVYPQWRPWRKAGYRSEGDAAANGKGAVYWLEGSKRYGFRYPVSVAEILDVEPGKRLAYTVLRGIPVRNYRAEVTLTPSPDGTLIRWGASWDRTIMGRLVYPSLRNLYPVIVAGLVNAAEASPELNAAPLPPTGVPEVCMPSGDSFATWDGALRDMRQIRTVTVQAIAHKYSDLARPYAWQNLDHRMRVKPGDAHA